MIDPDPIRPRGSVERTAAQRRETVIRGLHPSGGITGGDLWAGMDDLQRRFLLDRLGEIGVSHDEDHELGALPYVCSTCALAAVLVILEAVGAGR